MTDDDPDELTNFATKLADTLRLAARGQFNKVSYQNLQLEVGVRLGKEFALAERIGTEAGNVKSFIIACDVQDADYLCRGFIDGIGSLGTDIKLVCFWMRDELWEMDIPIQVSRITQEYWEPLPARTDYLIVLQAILSHPSRLRSCLNKLHGKFETSSTRIVVPIIQKGEIEKVLFGFDPDFVNEHDFIKIDEVSEGYGGGELDAQAEEVATLRFGTTGYKNEYMPALVNERRDNLPALRPW